MYPICAHHCTRNRGCVPQIGPRAQIRSAKYPRSASTARDDFEASQIALFVQLQNGEAKHVFLPVPGGRTMYGKQIPDRFVQELPHDSGIEFWKQLDRS